VTPYADFRVTSPADLPLALLPCLRLVRGLRRKQSFSLHPNGSNDQVLDFTPFLLFLGFPLLIFFALVWFFDELLKTR